MIAKVLMAAVFIAGAWAGAPSNAEAQQPGTRHSAGNGVFNPLWFRNTGRGAVRSHHTSSNTSRGVVWHWRGHGSVLRRYWHEHA